MEDNDESVQRFCRELRCKIKSIEFFACDVAKELDERRNLGQQRGHLEVARWCPRHQIAAE
jgi:hypothetical protein